MEKNIWVIFQAGLLAFSVYIGPSIYAAGIKGIIQEYHVSSVAATLGLTYSWRVMDLVRVCRCLRSIPRSLAHFFGRAGPMLWSPLSEMYYIGRIPIYIFTLFLYIALKVPIALATNFWPSISIQASLDRQSLQQVLLPTYTLSRSERTVSPSVLPSPYAPVRWDPSSAVLPLTRRAGDLRYGN